MPQPMLKRHSGKTLNFCAAHPRDDRCIRSSGVTLLLKIMEEQFVEHRAVALRRAQPSFSRFAKMFERLTDLPGFFGPLLT